MTNYALFVKTSGEYLLRHIQKLQANIFQIN